MVLNGYSSVAMQGAGSKHIRTCVRLVWVALILNGSWPACYIGPLIPGHSELNMPTTLHAAETCRFQKASKKDIEIVSFETIDMNDNGPACFPQIEGILIP